MQELGVPQHQLHTNREKRKDLKHWNPVIIWEKLTIFNIPRSTQENIAKAGEEFLLALYGGSHFKSLDDFTLTKFKKKNFRNSLDSAFQMASLPPTSAAAH